MTILLPAYPLFVEKTQSKKRVQTTTHNKHLLNAVYDCHWVMPCYPPCKKCISIGVSYISVFSSVVVQTPIVPVLFVLLGVLCFQTEAMPGQPTVQPYCQTLLLLPTSYRVLLASAISCSASFCFCVTSAFLCTR